MYHGSMIPYGCIEPYRNLHMKVFAMLLNIMTTEIGKMRRKKEPRVLTLTEVKGTLNNDSTSPVEQIYMKF